MDRKNLWILLPLVAVVAVFGPSAIRGEFISDDWDLIAKHLHPGGFLGEWTTPSHIWAAGTERGYVWRPLPATVQQVLGETLGRRPLPFRLLNVVLHAGNALLLLAVARRLGATLLGASLLATLWALFPAMPDAVCWPSAIGDLLGTSFVLGTMFVAFSNAKLPFRSVFTASLLLLACLAKESAAPFALVLAFGLLLLRNWRQALAIGGAAVAAVLVHGSWHAAVVGQGTGSALADASLPSLGETWLDFFGQILTGPVRAGFMHLIPLAPWRPSILPGQGLSLSAGLVVLVVLLLRSRAALVALLGWGVMLVPAALAAVDFGQEASRYVYLPMAVAMAFAGGVHLRARLGLPIALALLAFWAPWTVIRTGEWQSERTLYLAEYTHEPDNPLAQKVLGRLLVSVGRPEAGLPLWKRALDNPPPPSFVFDLQRERLDFASQAVRVGANDVALEQLHRFLADETRQGRPIDPSVWDLIRQADGTDAWPEPLE
jgi:hypothetical protein